MRISERYIKMCEKAEEIQREWKPERGDWCIEKKGKPLYPLLVVEISFIYCSDYGLSVFTEGGELRKVLQSDLTWLPTQEQLQEMMGFYPHTWGYFLFFIKETGAFGKFSSMNELWLAYVMSEKYQKVWDDWKEEWVKGGIHEV